MNRRHFLQAAAAAPFMPRAVAAAAAAEPAADWCFHDERFAEARRLILQADPLAALTPVRGDVTDVWNAGLGECSARMPLTLRGVTTESFHFCLKTLLASTARVDTAIARVDRDLFRWVIHSNGRGLST